MIWIIISFICIMIAAICNAVMDKCSFHFHKSIFFNLDEQFWNPELSWRNKYIDGDSMKGRVKWFWGINKPVQITDSFHLFKMLMIIFICAASIFTLISDIKLTYQVYLIMYFGYGVAWNTTFSLFFDKIFKK